MKISDEGRLKQKRSEGKGMEHTPFINARDIASNGRKTRARGQHIKRVYTLLSDLEYFFFAACDFACSIKDIREQVKIPLEETLAIAKEKNIKHPTIPGTVKPSIMTTDLVVDLEIENQIVTTAINVKPRSKWTNRAIQKMEIERLVYKNRNQGWLIASDLERDPNLEWNLLFLRQHFDLGISNSPVRFLQHLKLVISKKKYSSIDDAIISIEEKIGLETGEGYQLFYHLLARKKIKFDYHKRLDRIDQLNEFYFV